MRITQDVRDYAQAHRLDNLEIAIAEGMKEKADAFVKEGGKIYQQV
jgi:phosphomethylpyrimidine synthase